MCILLLQLHSKMKISLARDPLFSCFEFQMEYIAMWEALDADLAGLGGIDDVEDGYAR